jgi:hypothetical protein
MEKVAERKTVKQKLTPAKIEAEREARYRLRLHITLIFCSGIVTFVITTVHLANPGIMAFGPVTPSFIQEAVDYLKGLG